MLMWVLQNRTAYVLLRHLNSSYYLPDQVRWFHPRSSHLVLGCLERKGLSWWISRVMLCDVRLMLFFAMVKHMIFSRPFL